MNKMEESFLRLCLHPKVECDLPGRLRISFSKYHLLPKEALPYLHYIQDVLQLLPGVSRAEVNPRIGTVLLRYDAAVTNTRAILRWVDIVVDEGICISKEDVWQNAGEKELEEIVRQRLILRLPQQKKG
ncbi:MAG: hypothetical protein ACLUE8_08325 [Lachnospiraceae bacterium]